MLKKCLSILKNILLWVIVAVMVLVIFLSLASRQGNTLPSILGTSMVSVQSDSMAGDAKDNFNKGDLIFVKQLKDEQKADLKAGDIITFADIIENQRTFNTHRIVEVKNVGGILSFTTQGDNNITTDSERRLANDIVGIYNGKKITNGGEAFDFIQSKWGFFFCLIVPLAVFFVWRLFKLIKAYSQYSVAKEKDNN